MGKISVHPHRVRLIHDQKTGHGPIIYWMQRDQRSEDNWALLFSLQLAQQQQSIVIVCFNVVEDFLASARRQVTFMLQGLELLQTSLARYNIPLFISFGRPEENISRLVTKYQASALVCDFNPLRLIQSWKAKLASRLQIPMYEVDAHNILPCWHISDKQEYAAFTFRKKVQASINQYLTDYPKLIKQKHLLALSLCEQHIYDHQKILSKTKSKNLGKPIGWLVSGEKAAIKVLKQFILKKLADYDLSRNDPNKDSLSNLSPYLHFGHISAQRVALTINGLAAQSQYGQAFLEELIVRRELADNFCYYNKNYDNLQALPNWARKTLDEHRQDPRPQLYNLDQLENAQTHDLLWNAAQKQMLRCGKMHGYLRMYWAKKILEWSVDPETAMRNAIYLNDTYQLDGRDANGYAGIAWSIGGVHDRAWPERAVFGKIRSMTFDGCKRKFDIYKFITYQNEMLKI